MRNHVPQFQQTLAYRRRAPRTVQAYGRVIEASDAFIGGSTHAGEDIAVRQVEAFLARRRQDGARRSAASHNDELAALRAFSEFAQDRLGWMQNATNGILFLREAARDPAVLTACEVTRLPMSATHVGPSSRASALAVLAILSQLGLRVHELAALDARQVDLQSATLISTRDNSGSVHDLPVECPTDRAPDRLARCPYQDSTSRRAGPVRVHARKRISVRTGERLRTAIGTRKHLNPRTLRHSCATLALDIGSDLSTVSEMLRQRHEHDEAVRAPGRQASPR